MRSFMQKELIFRTKNKKGFVWVFSGWNLKKPLSYLKSTLSNLSTCKILQKKKQKMPKFGTKNALLGYFWAGI